MQRACCHSSSAPSPPCCFVLTHQPHPPSSAAATIPPIVQTIPLCHPLQAVHDGHTSRTRLQANRQPSICMQAQDGIAPPNPHTLVRLRELANKCSRKPTPKTKPLAEKTHTMPQASSHTRTRPMPFYPLLHAPTRSPPAHRPARRNQTCDFPPNPGIPVHVLPAGILGRPKFSSRSRMTLSAFRLRRYGKGALASARPTPGSTWP